MFFFGIVLPLLLFGSGAYSFLQGSCTLVGRGNPPFGTAVTFHGSEARLVSFIYIGASIWLFGGALLSRFQARMGHKFSWAGAIILLIGLFSLVTILLFPVVQQ
jgi:hypothetical protein